MNEKLTNRAKSGFPVSIGTGLALETLFTAIEPVVDESRKVNNLPDLSVYNLYLFNVSTLLRNLINTVKFADLLTISKKDIYEILLEEIDFLNNFFMTNNVDIRFYLNTYEYVKRTYENKNCLRKSSTDKQFFIDGITTYCLDQLRKEDDVTVFHKDIRYSKEDSALIFTHIPFDLLSYSNFIKLDLLESHTGVVKSRKDWWTKYYPVPNEDMSFLPLLEYFLAEIFGDHVMFTPAPIKKRVEVIQAMRKKGINPLTSITSLMFILGKS